MLNVKRLKEIRENLGLSQTDLAKKIGVTPSHYSNIENAKRGFSTSTMKQILKVLGIKIEDVWEGSGDNGPLPVYQAQGDAIVIEKTRYILPNNRDTYRLIAEQITERAGIDPAIEMVLRQWNDIPKEAQDRIFRILEECRDSAQGK
jgi:transcriptional regulator with XRE-family HTH domain